MQSVDWYIAKDLCLYHRYVQTNKAAHLSGHEISPIKDLYFENIKIKANKGFFAENAQNINLKNTTIEVKGNLFNLANTYNIVFNGNLVK